MRTIIHDVAHQQVAADGDVPEQRQVRRPLVDHRCSVVWDACACRASSLPLRNNGIREDGIHWQHREQDLHALAICAGHQCWSAEA